MHMNHHAIMHTQSQSQIELIVSDLSLKLIFHKSFWKSFHRFSHITAASPWRIPCYKLCTMKYWSSAPSQSLYVLSNFQACSILLVNPQAYKPKNIGIRVIYHLC